MRREPMVEPAETEELFVAFANTLSHTRGAAHDDIADCDWLRGPQTCEQPGPRHQGGACGATRTRPSRPARAVPPRCSGGGGGSLALAKPLQLAELEPHPAPWVALPPAADRGPAGNRYEVSQVAERLDQARAAIVNRSRTSWPTRRRISYTLCANDGLCVTVFVDRSPGRKAALVRHAEACGDPGQGGAGARACRELAAGARSPAVADWTAPRPTGHPRVARGKNPQRANASQRGDKLEWTRAPVAAARGNGLAPYPLPTTGTSAYREPDIRGGRDAVSEPILRWPRPPLRLPAALSGPRAWKCLR